MLIQNHERKLPNEATVPDFVVGLVRIELTTSALSVLRSNRLSYSPVRVRGYTTPTIGSEGVDWPSGRLVAHRTPAIRVGAD